MKVQKWHKKALGLAIAAISAFGFSACNIQFGTEPTIETLYYQRVDGKEEFMVLGIGTFTGADLEIPATFKGLPVTEIAPRAFQDCTTLSSITLPDTIQKIGVSAFEGCDTITSVTIPEQVTHISASAFKGCADLETVVLPSGLKTIDYWAFDGCDKLTQVYYHGADSDWAEVKVQLNNTPLDEAVVYAYSNEEPVKHGGYWHYVNNEITIWETMRHMWLYSGSVEATCSNIGYTVMVCHFCETETKTNMTDKLPHTWTDSVVAPTCEEQGYDLKTCDVCGEEEKSNFIDALDHDWGDVRTFAPTCTMDGYNERICGRCEQAEQTNFVDKFGHGTMKDGKCSVCGAQIASEGLVYELSVDRTYAIVKGYTGTDEIVCISDTYEGKPVTHIANEAFANNTTVKGFKTLSGIKSIGASAFENCTNLNVIILPASTTHIGAKAFNGCTSLTSILVSNDNTAYQTKDRHLFTKDGGTLVQYALGSSATAYTVPTGVTNIGANAFAGSKTLTKVTMQEGVVMISARAFENCTALTSVTFAEGLLFIDNSAFAKCSALTAVELPSTLQEIGAWAFSDCEALTSIVLPNSVTKVSDYAFFNCTGLKSLVLSSSLTSIGAQAFAWCRSLLEVVIPETVATIGAGAFAHCPGLDIYCEASQAPDGWATDWNQDDRPVTWN